MLDTLALVLSLALPDSAPVVVAYPPAPSRPVVVAYPPAPSRPVLVARLEESAPENLTTCFQARSGSCWTEE